MYFYISNLKPYPFIPLIQARPGLPLTIEYMNNLIKAIIKLANENNIALAKSLNFVQPNEIVKSRKFNDIIYTVKQFLTFDFNTYFLLDCYGSIFSNLVNSKSAFLNVLIYNLQYPINANNTYIKNLIIYQLDNTIYLNGYSIINDFLIGTNNGTIVLNDNAIIENLICRQNYGEILINGNAIIINNKCFTALFSTTLQQTLPDSISLNARYFLPPNKIVFQLTPGSTGDYAVLINPDGSVSVLPDNTTINSNTDYSNITGYSTVPGLIAFGGGEEAYNPWSPCAEPCSPYVAFYNTSTQQLSIFKIPGGSCDNMNTSSIVKGNSNDIIAIGGANPGSLTGGTGYVIFNSSLSPYLYGTFALTDSAGNSLYLYRMPKITVGNNLYLIAGINNSNTIAIEYVPLQLLYTNGHSYANVLCNSETITPNYITTITNDFNYEGILSIYTDGTNIYFVYYSTNGYVKLVIFDTFTNTVISIKQLIQLSNNSSTFTIANGYVYVSVQQTNSFTVYKFDLNGNLITSKSFTGTGFIDMNGYIVQFTNGLNAGSKILVYPPF
ncbi:hypothetical protein [Saccharolobus islandicus]|nr:hypothetical protein [Sulfolobus islandicus]